MSNNLFPDGYEAEPVSLSEISTKKAVGYKPSLAFDFQSSDFTLDGKQRIKNTTGIDAWRDWCRICVSTERYEHLAYSTDFGIETEEAFKAPTRQMAESLLTRQITEALAADPYGRTDYVESVQFNWTNADSVEVTAIVHGIENATIDVTAYITKR